MNRVYKSILFALFIALAIGGSIIGCRCSCPTVDPVLPPHVAVIDGAPALMVSGGNVLSVSASLPQGMDGIFTPVSLGDGKYIAVLSTWGNGQKASYQYPMTLGGTQPTPPGPPTPPPPGPPTPPPPAPLSPLATVTRDAGMKVPADARGKAVALADALDAHCAAIAAGTFKTTAEARAAIVKAAAGALGEANDKWLDWSVAVAKEMDAMAQAGKLKTLDDYRAAWGDVAKGLREVK